MEKSTDFAKGCSGSFVYLDDNLDRISRYEMLGLSFACLRGFSAISSSFPNAVFKGQYLDVVCQKLWVFHVFYQGVLVMR